MRIWHQSLLSKLPSKKDYLGCSNQLGGQHTEIRMMLGSIKKHGKLNHSTVNYANEYSISHLRAYGLLVIDEMLKRNFNMGLDIIDEYMSDIEAVRLYELARDKGLVIFDKHHNDEYMEECLLNLEGKGIRIAA